MPEVPQPVTDNSVKVRQLTHYQFSWTAGEAGKPGTYTLQLVLDQGAWEEVLTLDPDDADNLQDLLTNTATVHYDIDRRVLMFGVTPTGSRRRTSLPPTTRTRAAGPCSGAVRAAGTARRPGRGGRRRPWR